MEIQLRVPVVECMQVGNDGYHSIAEGLAVRTEVLVVVEIVAEQVTEAQRTPTLFHDHVVVETARKNTSM